MNLDVITHQTSCDRKVPGSKQTEREYILHLYPLHANKDFVPYMGDIASPGALACL